MTSRNSQAMGLAIVAGILLLIAGVSGLATWETIKDFVTTHVIDNAIVQIVFVILIFIASLGGIAVIIGGLFYLNTPQLAAVGMEQLQKDVKISFVLD